MASLTFVAATRLEYNALRRAMPRARIKLVGIALAHSPSELGEVVVSAGLAGGLREDLHTGTLLIPRAVRRPDGSELQCDPELVELFALRARQMGIEPLFDRLLTSSEIVRGEARAGWAAQGYSGVDMETGRICAPRVAAVRVVLDTPLREISADWVAPLRAILNPWNWPEALWLAREAPRAAALAANVAAGAQGIGAGLRM